MLETKTTWEDSGHDCEHCGGEVLLRKDFLPNGLTDVLYQCRECGCQWSLDGDWLRVGDGRSCQAAHRKNTASSGQFSRRLIIGLGILLLIAAARLGGIGGLRYILLLAVFGLLGWTIIRLGREYHWW